MVCFQTRTPVLGKFWRALEWKQLVYSITIWNTLRPLFTFYIWPLGNLLITWYISPRFGILNKEKSGNPALERSIINSERFSKLSSERFRKLVWTYKHGASHIVRKPHSRVLLKYKCVRVARWVCEKSTKCSPIPFLSKLIQNIYFGKN
jgi:hypothetical protein